MPSYWFSNAFWNNQAHEIKSPSWHMHTTRKKGWIRHWNLLPRAEMHYPPHAQQQVGILSQPVRRRARRGRCWPSKGPAIILFRGAISSFGDAVAHSWDTEGSVTDTLHVGPGNKG